MMNKPHLLSALLTITLFCGIFFPGKASAFAEETDRQIANKLQKINRFIKKQPEEPSFQKVFEYTVWSFKGTPYEGYGHDPVRPEVLEIKLDHVGCVSLMEIALALSRVAYCGDLSVAAVYKEVQKLRYRHGEIKGFSSRLHYFSEWLDQAQADGTIADRTMELGGQSLQRSFNYMTSRPELYPPLALAKNRQCLKQVEKNLSQRQFPFLAKDRVAGIEPLLEPGDMIAIVTSQEGIVISHVMMVTLFGQEPHLVHASSHLQRVASTPMTISKYLANSPKRTGIRISRVLPPKCPLE